MKKQFKKIIVSVLIALLLMGPGTAKAYEIPSTPTVPETPTVPVDQTVDNNQQTESSNEPEDQGNSNDESNQNNENNQNNIEGLEENEINSQQGGNVGDTNIETGDVITEGAIVTEANNSSNSDHNTQSNIDANNLENSQGSSNAIETGNTDSVNNQQNNNAQVDNGLDLESNSGENNSSKNVGETSISTGDANTSGTMVTSANTNANNISVSEFNIVEDQNGDIILNFEENCIAGCQGGLSAGNIENGADSINNITVGSNSESTTAQENIGIVDNYMDLYANSGFNHADKNTGGETSIETGDANIAANVLNLLNNNLQGNIALGIVNVFGDLVGDIILPDSVFICTNCPTDLNAQNTGNGSSSQNNIYLNNQTVNDLLQTNNGTINNVLNFSAVSGNNETSSNTGGTSSIKTGAASIDSQTLNIINSNLSGNWWLVIVNEAGQWIGKIIGAPQGASFGGSESTEFIIGENGEITAINAGNGASSDNNVYVDTSQTNSTVQENSAVINNNINLYANTGNNTASKNTGGEVSISTGDARIIANLINFVNNNISGNGKLVVTVVNVFGSWLGDFLGPGMKKEKAVNIQKSTAGKTVIQEISSSSSTSTSSTADSSIALNSKETEETTLLKDDVFISVDQQKSVYVHNQENSSSNQTRVKTVLAKSHTPIKEDNLRINLAWFSLLIPLSALFLILRRIKNLRNFEIKKL